MASNTRTIRMILVLAAAVSFPVFVTRMDARTTAFAGAPEKVQESVRKLQAQPCPGCDADMVPGTCGQFAPEEAGGGVRIPYGVGASGYRDISGINNANRIIGRSGRSLNDSIRRMNDSINRIRNIHRRF